MLGDEQTHQKNSGLDYLQPLESMHNISDTWSELDLNSSKFVDKQIDILNPNSLNSAGSSTRQRLAQLEKMYQELEKKNDEVERENQERERIQAETERRNAEIEK